MGNEHSGPKDEGYHFNTSGRRIPGSMPSASRSRPIRVDFYEILGVEKTATTSEIRRSYLRKVVEAHPDKNLEDQDGAAKKFRVVQKAYDVLMDEDTRDEYDQSPHRFHLEIADCVETGNTSDETDTDDKEEYYGDYIDPFMFFAQAFGRGGLGPQYRRPANERSEYTGPKPDVSIEDIARFLASVDDMIWTKDTSHPKCAYTLIAAFYERLAADDRKFSHKSSAIFPSFGTANSVFDRALYRDEERKDLNSIDLHRFYGFWMNFQTAKKFEWVEGLHYCRCGDRMCPAAKFTRQLREVERRRFEEVVRVTSTALRDIDPRYEDHLQRKKDPTAYSATSLKTVGEERQRQKAKKRQRKKNAKGKW